MPHWEGKRCTNQWYAIFTHSGQFVVWYVLIEILCRR